MMWIITVFYQSSNNIASQLLPLVDCLKVALKTVLESPVFSALNELPDYDSKSGLLFKQ